MAAESVELSSETTEALQTDTQRTVATIWADVLKTGSFTLDDDFFAIGGNSMTATLVTYSLRDKFGIEFPLMLIFENATVAELAAAVDGIVKEQAND
jgi:acyl carrier protein